MPGYLFDHIHLISPDPLQTSAFYEDIFGASRAGVAETAAGPMVRMEIGGSAIAIMPPRKQPLLPAAGIPIHGLEHFGLKTDNLEQAVAKLKARDIRFALDIIEPKPGFKTSFIVAPDNVLVELFEGSG